MLVDVVSAEGAIFSGSATLVVVEGCEGQLGITPRHAPLLTRIVPGELRVMNGNTEVFLGYISGGILEIQPHHVTVLGDTVVRGEDLNEAEAAGARAFAESSRRGAGDKLDLARAERELIEAAARYKVLQRFRRRHPPAGER
jgi:F-type H+-transporting ATPase subunit epsilon